MKLEKYLMAVICLYTVNFSAITYASPVDCGSTRCRHKSTKHKTTAKTVSAPLVQAPSNIVDQDGLLRDATGKVLKMNQSDAVEACAKYGMRLPSARELMQMSQSAGIVIKEKNEVTDKEIRSGEAWPVSALDPNGKIDEFYYDTRAYVPPTGELGSQGNWFWSSSMISYNLNYAYYLRSGNYEDIRYDRWFKNAVRCVSDQQARTTR